MRRIFRGGLALFFVGAGLLHFLKPAPYLAIMPRSIPWPAAIVGASGAAEMLGGLGILLPATRKAAGWGLIALLAAVFPANLQAISTGMVIGGWPVPTWMLWARLPFQLLFVAWVYRTCLSKDLERSAPSERV